MDYAKVLQIWVVQDLSAGQLAALAMDVLSTTVSLVICHRLEDVRSNSVFVEEQRISYSFTLMILTANTKYL